MRTIVLALCLMLPLSIFAQQPFEGGLFLGFANYQGDLAEAPIEFGETKLAFGLLGRYHYDKNIAIKSNIFYGLIEGDDHNAKDNFNRDWRFKADVIEIGMNIEWKIFYKSRFNKAGIFRKQVYPYGYLGLALTFADAELEVPEQDQYRFPEEGDRSTFLAFPEGGGLKFDFSEHFSFGAEGGWRFLGNDFLDGVSRNGNKVKNDWYMFGGITLTYFFGDPQPDFGFRYNRK